MKYINIIFILISLNLTAQVNIQKDTTLYSEFMSFIDMATKESLTPSGTYNSRYNVYVLNTDNNNCFLITYFINEGEFQFQNVNLIAYVGNEILLTKSTLNIHEKYSNIVFHEITKNDIERIIKKLLPSKIATATYSPLILHYCNGKRKLTNEYDLLDEPVLDELNELYPKGIIEKVNLFDE